LPAPEKILLANKNAGVIKKVGMRRVD